MIADSPREPSQRPFKIVSEMTPAGDQPRAIEQLVAGLRKGARGQTLLGVTGSGKTFTMACVIEKMNRPTLVLSHNKTLAAQLYREFKELFPENAVEYFVSYYDYYMPEAYIPSTDTYIDKDAAINDELDKMRIAATKRLIERRDVVIVSSVSCIYGIGSPKDFGSMVIHVEEGDRLDRDDLLRRLVAMLYARGDYALERGTFRARGDVVDVFPAYEERHALRISFFGDEIESIRQIDAITGVSIRRLHAETIFPASHYVMGKEKMEMAVDRIITELDERTAEFRRLNKLVEEQRLRQRTIFDIEMMREMGTCKGIENYSRHLAGKGPGEPPSTLLEYFPDDFLMFIDESHVTLPQVQGMYRGDQARKKVLVEHGFRLPSALDNRPLMKEEFEAKINQVVYVSATPAERELEASEGLVVEQVARPTGLLDPPIEIRPAQGQVDDLLGEVRKVAERGERALVTTLTKRFSEELVEYYADLAVKVRYLHSDIDAIERTRIIRDLRAGEFDVLIGINLLREGLDLPEVSLVAILDADKEGFLRSASSLIQTCGRAARNANGRVIMYADRVTDSMKACVEETERRRVAQEEHNREHGITPRGVEKKIGKILEASYYENDPDEEMHLGRDGHADERYTQVTRGKAGRVEDVPKAKAGEKIRGDKPAAPHTHGKALKGRVAPANQPAGYGNAEDEVELAVAEGYAELLSDPKKLAKELESLRKKMKKAAGDLDFEEAAKLRDQIFTLEKRLLVDFA